MSGTERIVLTCAKMPSPTTPLPRVDACTSFPSSYVRFSVKSVEFQLDDVARFAAEGCPDSCAL